MISYWPGVLFSAVVHLLLVATLAWNWQSVPTPEIRTPRHVKATLVKLDLKTAVKPDVKPNIDKTDSAEQRRQRAAVEKKRRQLERQKTELKKKKREKKEQAQREQREQQLAQRQQVITNELAREKERLLFEEQARTDSVTSQSYSALIAARIEQNWSRPPSARKGMQCELEIHMVPTGHVMGVQITKSSGNVAFDRSAVQAVKKIERFSEIKGMPSRVFERYFRRFKLSFNPKDLRL